MRKIVLTGIVATALFALVAYAQDIPETLVIDDCADAKAPVEFPHKAHFEVTDCTTCHHKTEGLTLETAASMEVKSCATCHAEPEDAETPACTEKGLSKNPFHITCVGCHKDMAKEAKAAGEEFSAPTKCTACHPKEK